MARPYAKGYEGVMEWFDHQPRWLRDAINGYGPEAFGVPATMRTHHPKADLEQVLP